MGSDNNDEMDKSGNCLPGTVIDSVITQPVGKDFYLQSHAGLLGTSRPAHYHVLLDENNLTNETDLVVPPSRTAISQLVLNSLRDGDAPHYHTLSHSQLRTK